MTRIGIRLTIIHVWDCWYYRGWWHWEVMIFATVWSVCDNASVDENDTTINRMCRDVRRMIRGTIIWGAAVTQSSTWMWSSMHVWWMGLNNGKLINSASPLPFCEQVELTALGSVNSQAVIISALIVGWLPTQLWFRHCKTSICNLVCNLVATKERVRDTSIRHRHHHHLWSLLSPFHVPTTHTHNMITFCNQTNSNIT